MTRLLVIPLKIYTFIISLPLSYPLYLCSHLSLFLSLAPCLTCRLYLALMSSFFLYFLELFFPTVFSFNFLPLHSSFSLAFLLCFFFFPLTIFWLFEDMAQHHVSGHWRTFRSQQESDCCGLLGSYTHTQTHTHKFIHTLVLSSQIPLKELLSHKARCHREKNKEMFSLFTPPFLHFLSSSHCSLQ